MIAPANPRANGVVERYNACLKAGFRRMASVAGIGWEDALPDILSGLRFLPTKLGVAPYLLVFKQEPLLYGDSAGIPGVVE